MTSDPQRVRDYLGHILQAISRIQRYAGAMHEADFRSSEITQDAVIRNLEVIGEACRNIERDSPGFAASHPELPLAFAYEMRNVLAHGYFKIDLAIVWRTIQRDLPALRQQVQVLIGEPPTPQV
jgi:uncharacterized protein with HEPN domain